MKKEKLSEDYTVIIANGIFPSHTYPTACIENAKYTICLDGALDSALKNNITPNIIIGDGDSISEQQKKKYAHLLHLFKDQDTNDLTKAINYCIKSGMKKIKIIAATGKREDHTLGNIFLLLEYIYKLDVEMITDYGVFTPIKSTTKFQSAKGQQVSIFTIDKEPITSYNLKYPLKTRILDNLWEGTLNESLGRYFSIESEGRVIVYRTFIIKK